MFVKPAVRRSPSLLTDVGIVTVLVALLYGVLRMARHWQAPLQTAVAIDLSLWALPGYAFFSLLRALLAYACSLLFALGYGYIAAHRPAAERILLPLLDVLQSVPVLGFLPGTVLAMVALFPRTNTGLELGSIFMIFTGQAWNMAFSVYQSLRSIPPALQEAAVLYRFTWWQRIRRIELPAVAVGLAWNSMMAMAGGWFFLMVCEAFTLGSSSFTLPGLGSYMSVAIARGDGVAMGAGVTAMIVMILSLDVCVWRPVLAWVQRFRLEETTSTAPRHAVVGDWLRHSKLVHVLMARVAHPISEWLSMASSPPAPPPVAEAVPASRRRLVRAAEAVLGGGAILAVAWTLWHVGHLLGRVSVREWLSLAAATSLTFARVLAAVAVGTLWTVPVGVWIGSSDRRRVSCQPLVQVAASFPAPMLYPLVLLIFQRIGWGLGIGSVILMLLGTQWYILFNVIAGASSVPTDLREAAYSYGFTRWQEWRSLWWPAVFPYLVTGWVTAAGGAWNASIVAEYVSLGPQRPLMTRGIGALISVAASQRHDDLLAAGVLSLVVCVVLLNRFVWRPCYQFAERRYSL